MITLLCDFFFSIISLFCLLPNKIPSIQETCIQLNLAAWKHTAHWKTVLPPAPPPSGFWAHADPPPNSSVGLEDPRLPYADSLVNCQQRRLREIQTGEWQTWVSLLGQGPHGECSSENQDANVTPYPVEVSAGRGGIHPTLKRWRTESLIFIIHKKWSLRISDIFRTLQPLMRWGKWAMPLPSGPQVCLFEYVIIRTHEPLWGSMPRVHYTPRECENTLINNRSGQTCWAPSVTILRTWEVRMQSPPPPYFIINIKENLKQQLLFKLIWKEQ